MFSSISSSPVITTMKLEGSNNYTPWSSSVEMWFIAQGYEDHLVKILVIVLLVKRLSGLELMLNYAISYGTLWILNSSTCFNLVKLAIKFGLKLRLCI